MRHQAIILKKIPIREYDQLIICYTRESGKQVYQAKSILLPISKQAGHLEALNLVDFSLVHKNSHPIITSAHSLESFRRLKSSLSAMAAAHFLLECFDKLVFEGDSDHKLWDFLLTRLELYNSVDVSGKNLAEVIISTKRSLLQILGYDSEHPIEQLANSKFRSLQFARSVVRYL